MAESTGVLAVDIGGTKIAAAVVEEGRVVTRHETPTPARDGAAAILQAVRETADAVLAGHDVCAAGVGAAGVVDAAGRVTSATDILTGWAGTDVARHLRTWFAVPVVVVNDAHAHAVGEAMAGAGRGHRTVLSIAVGTGIGGAVVVDGMPLTGAHGAAGHLGHIPCAAAVGLRCSCGRLGHLEPLASGTGIGALYTRRGGARPLTGREVAEAAERDPIAAGVLADAGSAFGEAVGGLVNVVDPGVVVISGGVQHAGSRWWDAVRAAVGRTVLPALEAVPIVAAVLGDDAALLGAAHLARRGRTPVS